MSERLYLENLAHKVQLYVDAKEEAIKWLVENQIKDKNKIQNALIMSQIWIAHQLGHNITMSDLMIYLGDNADVTFVDNRLIQLDEDMIDMNLQQVLQASVI